MKITIDIPDGYQITSFTMAPIPILPFAFVPSYPPNPAPQPVIPCMPGTPTWETNQPFSGGTICNARGGDKTYCNNAPGVGDGSKAV